MKALSILTAIFMSILVVSTILISASEIPASETVDIVRDFWGVPHIFASSSEAAFYGLGYSTAEDRMFQMEYSRRIVKGTISEIMGEKGIQSDTQWKTIGWYRHAQEMAENLEPTTKSLLEAYAAGVNNYLQEQSNLLYLFQKYGISPEKWTVADSIACWYRLSYFFNGLDGGEVTNLHNFENLIKQVGFEQATQQLFTSLPIDESGAIVQESDMDSEALAELKDYLSDHGYNSRSETSNLQLEQMPKASHAWVIGGNKTTTGTAILHSDPQITIFAPSIWYEFHISGGEFEARGIGVAGAPGLLIGWNRNIAWGATAAKSDIVDLYRLEINPNNANEYKYNGAYLPIEVHSEEIKLLNGTKIPLTHSNTVFGPVVTSLLANPMRDQFAMQHAELVKNSGCSLLSLIKIMKATNYETFSDAIADYRSPSIHMIYGDSDGNIAYQLLAGIPLRSSNFPFFGSVSQPGNSSAYMWQEIIPKKYLPSAVNPQSGVLSTANNLAAGSWYPVPTNLGTGDTIRSWRLRELLSAQSVFSPEDVLAIHQDTLDPAVREIVRLARYVEENTNQSLSTETQLALSVLKDWNNQYNSSQVVYPLISNFNLMFRSSNTPLALTYGGGEGGLTSFAKSIKQNLDNNSTYLPTDDELAYVDTFLKNAWTKTSTEIGNDPSMWLQNYNVQIRVKYQNNLENFGSIDANVDIMSPTLICTHTATILSQHGNSYSQNVRFDNIDLSKSILPLGSSENPSSAFFINSISLWIKGELHDAPLSRELVEKNALNTSILVYPPLPTPTPSPTPAPTSASASSYSTSSPTIRPTAIPTTPCTPTPVPSIMSSPEPTTTPQPQTETPILIYGVIGAAVVIAVISGFVVFQKTKLMK